MLKKILLASFFTFFVFSTISVYAFINRSPARIYGKIVSYTAEVVSNADFDDTIWISATTTPNTTLNIKADFKDGKGVVPVGTGTYTTDSSGKLEFSFNHTWTATSLPYTYTANMTIFDPANNLTDSATYNLKASYAPISLTNDIPISDGATIKTTDTQPTFTCTNATEMYYDGALVASDYNGGSGYTLKYSTPGSLGSHKLSCHNIEANDKGITSGTVGSTVYPLINWTVKAVTAAMTGAITPHDPSCTIASGASSCTVALAWKVTNPENVGGSAITSDTTKTGVLTSTTVDTGDDNSNNSVTIPYSSRNFYLYNNAKLLDQTTGTASCTAGTSWNGSKCAVVPTCPSDASGTYPSCVCNNYGYTYDSTSNKCILSHILCSKGYANSALTACSTGPTCSLTSNGATVQCTNIPYCSNGNIAVMYIDDTSRTVNSPYSFAWNSGDKTYYFNCPNTSDGLLYSITAIARPFTHFLIFNASASNIQKGSKINLSWTIQDPTNKCSIKAESLVNGAVLWNTDSNNQPSSIVKSKIVSTTTKNVAIGSASITVDQSTRFTATCINDSSYNSGTYTLKRDVYVTGESETR